MKSGLYRTIRPFSAMFPPGETSAADHVSGTRWACVRSRASCPRSWKSGPSGVAIDVKNSGLWPLLE